MKPELRDEVTIFVEYWQGRTEIPVKRLLGWLGVRIGKYHDWKQRRGLPNNHNAPQPRHYWLLQWEKEAIINYAQTHPQEGYRRLAYMMLDEGIVAVSPSSAYRVLKRAGLLGRAGKPTSKGDGFKQPSRPHQHWHIDISYINIAGTFYYLCSVLDGYSRYIVHWELREQMTEQEVEVVLQRAKERHTEAKPRIISDNGPQFIARDFKEFVRIMGMTHVRTSPYYPQSNGKLERWHKTLKSECIRPKSPVTQEDAKQLLEIYVNDYNAKRLHSAIGYIPPLDKLEGRAEQIFAKRQQKLALAAKARSKTNELHHHVEAA